jgi:hypothetical protein
MIDIFSIQTMETFHQGVNDDGPPIHRCPGIGVTPEDINRNAQNFLIVVDPGSADDKVRDTRVSITHVEDVDDAGECRGAHSWSFALPADQLVSFPHVV